VGELGRQVGEGKYLRISFWDAGVALMVECLPSKDLSSNTSTTKKKKPVSFLRLSFPHSDFTIQPCTWELSENPSGGRGTGMGRALVMSQIK
jgi:hypothetical protein